MNDNILNITVRLVVAMVLGGIVGLEREYRAKDAGSAHISLSPWAQHCSR